MKALKCFCWLLLFAASIFTLLIGAEYFLLTTKSAWSVLLNQTPPQNKIYWAVGFVACGLFSSVLALSKIFEVTDTSPKRRTLVYDVENMEFINGGSVG
jgi:hypothetical protein